MVSERAFDQLGDLVHEDVVIVSKMRPGLVLEGRSEVLQHMQETLADNLYEATTTAYLPVDEQRIVVEGRIRWIDDERVIRDDPVTWAMEFRDDLLTRFIPARTQVEAETMLGARRSSSSGASPQRVGNARQVSTGDDVTTADGSPHWCAVPCRGPRAAATTSGAGYDGDPSRETYSHLR